MTNHARHTQLDGLRGYAAIAVIVFHSLLDRDPSLDARIIRPSVWELQGLYDLAAKVTLMVANGEIAVIAFFTLSGALLFESLRNRHVTPIPTAVGFFLRRFIRLYPTFFFFLAVSLLTFVLTRTLPSRIPLFWPNAALYDFSVLGVSWTLQVEFLAIPILLAAFWSHQRWGSAGILVAYAGFIALLYLPWPQEHLLHFRRFLPCFAFGMLIPTQAGAVAARLLPVKTWPLLLIALLSVRHTLGLHGWTRYIAQILAALLIAQLFYHRGGSLGRFFDRPVSQYFGRISYSLYLCSGIYLTLFAHWTRNLPFIQEHPLEWGLLIALPIVGLSVLTAHVAERYIERPSIVWARRLTRFSVPPRLPNQEAASSTTR